MDIITSTELWQVLEEKAPKDTEFTGAVKKLCKDGIALSADVIRFFPTFTRHDWVHIIGVCEWMARLMGDELHNLRAEEAAMLLLAACWHDSGMCVSDAQKADYQEELAAKERPETWTQFFRRHPGYEVAYSEKHELTGEMLRAYVRENHAQRVGEQIPADWPDELVQHGLIRDNLIAVCQSHGESLEHSLGSVGDCDLNLCAVLLRLADALDYDAARTPDILYRQLGLDDPKTKEAQYSQGEWKKNGAGKFGVIRERAIHYTAKFDNPTLEHDVQAYVDWVKSELSVCGDFLHRYNGVWKDLELPYTVQRNISRKGYESGDFHLTMDQDKVIDLLAGDNLYSDPGVFVRELLQNAVDAVLMRRRTDPNFGEDDGEIIIRTWTDGEGYDWFRIEDDGIGMDEHILKNYFLKVGNSYYTSDEYRAELTRQKKGAHFTPISRFGIGILSCFMNAPDNRVEVLTRRYTDNTVYRLDMTGLHGYYFLTKATKENPGRELSKPKGLTEKKNYLHDVGTTVCVRTNLYGYGGSASFKDLVDKYVCFPEVNITYIGPEGEEHYPTQKELMDCVHSLNDNDPNHGIKEYVYPIPDEDYQKLKDELTYVLWDEGERPAIVLYYIPLDWVSVSEDIQGVAIRADVRANLECKAFSLDGKAYPLDFGASIEIVEAFPSIRLLFSQKNSFFLDAALTQKQIDVSFSQKKSFFFKRPMKGTKKEIEFLSIKDTKKEIKIPYSWIKLENRISEEEKTFFQMLKRPHNVRSQTVNLPNRFTDTAFNGVLADTDNLLGDNDPNLFGFYKKPIQNLTLLLRGENSPVVNLARDHISSLPPALAFDLDLLRDELFGRGSDIPPLLQSKHLALMTTRDYQDMLEKPARQLERQKVKHSFLEVENKLQEKGFVEISDFSRRPGDYLLLAALRERFSLQNAMSDWSVPSIIPKREEPDISGFPPSLFFQPNWENEPFGLISDFHINYYNIIHPFSKWLIENQKALQEKAPGFYNRILETMILEEEKDRILKQLNAILDQLRAFSGNPFHVPANLRLEEKDFTGK